MTFNLTEKQSYALLILNDDLTTEVGYGGAAGGGKSFLGCFWILQNAMNYPGTAWLIGRKELTNLKKTTLLSFFRVLDILSIKPEEIIDINNQTNIINFKNGSKIFLMDMAYQPTDPLYTRFGGLELTGAFIDESNENEIQAIEIIKTRLGRCKNKDYNLIPKLLETFNPSKNHVYYRYYKPSKDKSMPYYRMFITALATDNQYLDESYIEQLKRADKITKERLLYGNFEYDDDPSKIFNYDKILDIFTMQYHPIQQNRYISCDVARFGEDKTVIIVWNDMHILKIISMNVSSVKQVKEKIEQLAKEYVVPRSNIVIDEDGVGGGVVDFLEGVKGFINNSSPIENKSTTKFHNYKNLKTQCYFKLAEYVNSGKISCYDIPQEMKELIIEDLEQIAQRNIDKDTKIEIITKEELKEKINRSTDFSDAMMMRMYFELKTTYKPYIAK